MSQFGQRLSEVRHERGLTQEELARQANVALNTVARIENGRVEPNMSTLRKLAKALDVPPSRLIDNLPDAVA